jgi:hypothetical protein|tara:strand:+ start:393 stop:560 length:168 start_codon:yes stop_codon:yes gene_type:complete
MTFTYKKMWLDKVNNVIDTDTIKRSDGLSIPVSEGNRHYQEYLEWAKTNTIEEAD